MICKEKVDHKNIIYIAQFCGQAKGAKYFQPQPDSNPQLFRQCLKLLRDLAGFQNGAPLEKYKVEYEETMHEVWAFLGDYENGFLKHQPDSVDLEKFLRWYFDDDCNYVYHELAKYFETIDLKKQVPFSEVLEAFKSKS
jgi:hypothetical protein